ncbi:TniQ family protein [Hoeflea sp.]|uniref:TniQ family protein n=1 Tax=Hoeflea sp. TaxID=1940281 RepID=UPI00198AF0D9|nr:TniQ family protein [Hoeflea sp.]MBC7283464.1 TniQ family protein [Hoeflea sp.]
MMQEAARRQLPVTLLPVAGELLSSWIGRHAAFYAVPPLVMLRHCLPEARSLRAADLHLGDDQKIRLAKVFATEPAVVRRMTFTNVAQSSRRLIAVRPQQSCPNCNARRTEPGPTLRSQLVGWRLTCPICGDLFRDADGRELPSPFWQYRDTAILGEQLLDNEAERGIATWASPAEIARLLLMRRIPRPVSRAKDLWRFRVLGAIIPNLDGIIAAEQENLPTPASPILRLHMRPALLAGIAIVERAGPEMLRMLRRHMMGDNKFRFIETTERIIAHAQWPRSLQMQLI